MFVKEESTYLVDGISAIAIHNTVIRIQFMRLGIDGKATPCLELQVPTAAMKSVMEALRKIALA
jgi:hypothetical protein